MSFCDEMRAQVSFYLDDELSGDERLAFEAHMQSCASCRRVVESERRFLDAVREARPLYQPAPELRARVEGILKETPLPQKTADAPRRPRPAFWQALPHIPLSSHRRAAAMAAAVVILLLAGLWLERPWQQAPGRPSDFALMAVDTHLRYLRRQLPFEITSASPNEISDWFAGKVPFRLQLPNYQESSGQDRLYELEGARLVGFKNDYAAYVAYEMRGRPISLVVTSNTVAMPSGGEEIASRGLTFHYDAIDGLKVITWADRGLTYALVSDLEERGQQSCMVCHVGTKDRDFIESLKP